MTTAHEFDSMDLSGRESRSSIFLPPALRRRCLQIQIESEGADRLVATIFSRRWVPSRPVQAIVKALPGFRMARALRRVFGKRKRTSIVFPAIDDAGSTSLRIGEKYIKARSIGAIALQGWQEQFGHDRVWDVMLLGPNVDLVVGHKKYEEAEQLATALALVLGVSVKESSVGGGSRTAFSANINVRDAHYDAPQRDGWKHLKP